MSNFIGDVINSKYEMKPIPPVRGNGVFRCAHCCNLINRIDGFWRSQGFTVTCPARSGQEHVVASEFDAGQLTAFQDALIIAKRSKRPLTEISRMDGVAGLTATRLNWPSYMQEILV